jgi:hypothetical protein
LRKFGRDLTDKYEIDRLVRFYKQNKNKYEEEKAMKTLNKVSKKCPNCGIPTIHYHYHGNKDIHTIISTSFFFFFFENLNYSTRSGGKPRHITGLKCYPLMKYYFFVRLSSY